MLIHTDGPRRRPQDGGGLLHRQPLDHPQAQDVALPAGERREQRCRTRASGPSAHGVRLIPACGRRGGVEVLGGSCHRVVPSLLWHDASRPFTHPHNRTNLGRPRECAVDVLGSGPSVNPACVGDTRHRSVDVVALRNRRRAHGDPLPSAQRSVPSCVSTPNTRFFASSRVVRTTWSHRPPAVASSSSVRCGRRTVHRCQCRANDDSFTTRPRACCPACATSRGTSRKTSTGVQPRRRARRAVQSRRRLRVAVS